MPVILTENFLFWWVKKILCGPWTASIACRRGLGHMVLIGPQVCKWVEFYIFRLSYTLTSHDLWPSSVTFDLMNMWRFLHYINKPSLVPIGLPTFSNEMNFTFWAHLTTWPLMTFDLGIWLLTTWTFKGSHIVSTNQVWFQSRDLARIWKLPVLCEKLAVRLFWLKVITKA